MSASLTPQQARGIAALLSSKSITAAAVVCGCSERTLRRWMDDPDFASALREAETSLVEHAARRVAGLLGTALDTLAAGMDDRASTSQLRAAGMVLDGGLGLRMAADIEKRIADLEAATNE